MLRQEPTAHGALVPTTFTTAHSAATGRVTKGHRAPRKGCLELFKQNTILVSQFLPRREWDIYNVLRMSPNPRSYRKAKKENVF